ncbi:MAG: glycosyltransferase family 4 protein [Candidatus Parvarchaeota archaeon]|nr:glycosyltransferase family 4 protein [Candidatus Parvarchaeum tengchongense]
MRVLLVVPSLDVPKFKGLAKVSKILADELPKYGIETEVLEVHKNGKRYLSNLTSVPLRELFSKADIIHSTVPESGTFLPFMFWKKSVITFHDFIPFEMGERLKFRLKFLVDFYSKFMWGLASKNKVVVAVSTQTAKDFERYFGKKPLVVNPGVDEKFKPMKVEKEKITLGFFANFSYRKGVDKAVEVFRLVKRKIDCKLVLAGGYLQTVYQRQFDINELVKGLKDVEVLGYVPDEKVVELYNSFDFFLFPSIYEGFGLPILEAQKCGIPTLIFSWAKIAEEVKKKAIECSSVEEMANRIINLVENKEEYKKISKEGIEYASKFTWENFVKSYINIYRSLL